MAQASVAPFSNQNGHPKAAYIGLRSIECQ